MQTTFKEHPFKQARNLGVPIIAVETADPAATIRSCAATRNGRPDFFIQWDCIRGLTPIETAASEIAKEIGEPAETQNLVACLDLIAKKQPKRCSIFIHNAQAAFRDYTAIQALWNCRDELKAVGTTLILLGPALPMPPELANDVPVFEEPTPTTKDIDAKIDGAIADARKAKADYPTPSAEDRLRIVDTLTGYLSLFAIEQSLALATTKDGLNVRRLWELKVASLKNTAGLEISQPEANFNDLAGAYGAKELLNMLFNGRERPRGIFWLEEIEKMLAGTGDTSGTTQALIEQFLFWTESKKVLGLLFVGTPGSGKSWTAQCAAGEAKIPLLRGSMSTVKGSLVGESEANMRRMLKTVDSVTGNKPLMIATCNSLDVLTPEIMARFKLGTMVFAFPTQEESASVWELYRKKYNLGEDRLAPELCRNWVPREIESCCHRAWLFNVPLTKAAQSVVPLARSSKTKMQRLLEEMSGKYLSASKPGVFVANETNLESSTARLLQLG